MPDFKNENKKERHYFCFLKFFVLLNVLKLHIQFLMENKGKAYVVIF